MGALGPEQRKEPRYKVAYHTYLASGRRLSYTLSVERVVNCKYVKRSLLVRQIFATCRLRHAHVRKDTRLSPLYRTESDGKLGGAWERGYILPTPTYPPSTHLTYIYLSTLHTTHMHTDARRWFAAYSAAASFRYSHYFVSFLSECSTLAAGIGYQPQPHGSLTWCVS